MLMCLQGLLNALFIKKKKKKEKKFHFSQAENESDYVTSNKLLKENDSLEQIQKKSPCIFSSNTPCCTQR